MCIKWLHDSKEQNPGPNNFLGITITPEENSARNKKEERKNLAEKIYQL